MLIENASNVKNPWASGAPAGHATYIPSALLLLMAIDNGWEIVKIQPVARRENYGPVYLLTFRCHTVAGNKSWSSPSVPWSIRS